MQPDLAGIKSKIEANRDIVDRIFMKIPGYKGYVEKDESYHADKILRDFLADMIQSYKTKINVVSGDLMKASKVELLSDLDSLNVNFERLLKKVKSADFHSSATHGKMKMTDEDHNRLLEYDWRLISDLGTFDAEVDKLAAAADAALIAAIKSSIVKFEKSFDDRKNVLMEVF